MTLPENVLSVAVAIAAGGLIGAERQQAHAGEKNEDFGGIRTFPLVALAGACSALLRPTLGAWAFGALFVGVVLILAIAQVRSRSRDIGVSSEIAALITFALGAVAASPEVLPHGPRYLLVAAIAATTMALLALKRPLHGFIASVSEGDVYATVKFVLLALVVIPVLPNRTYGPLDVLNPFKIGLFTALIAGLTFAGYVAVRWIGSRRGLILTGLVGGLASSTAVTLTLAARVKEHPKLAGLSAVAIVAASATMFARVLVVVAVRDRPLLAELWAPLGAMAVVGFGASLLLYRKETASTDPTEPVPFHNPFELKRALQFGALYAVVLVIAKASELYVGRLGLYASAVVLGLTDVDAITLSLAELHMAGTASDVAVTGIILAATTNTLAKVGMATAVGGWRLGQRVGLSLITALAAGVVLLLLL
jgi:uncharacterized membrane protein (DUF4010 family)